MADCVPAVLPPTSTRGSVMPGVWASRAKRSRWLGMSLNIACAEVRADGRVLHIDDRRTAGDDQRLFDVGDLHRHVHRDGLADLDLRAFVDDLLELGLLIRDPVLTRRQIQDAIGTVGFRHRRSLALDRRSFHRDRDARHKRIRRVHDPSIDAAGELLC